MTQSHQSLTIRIADLPIAVNCPDVALLDALRKRYVVYLVDAVPEFRVDILSTSKRDGVAPFITGCAGPKSFSFEFDNVAVSVDLAARAVRVERCCDAPAFHFMLRNVMALALASEGGFLVHAAGVSRQGGGFLFPGPSESGKTTVSRLGGADVLNDECVAVRNVNGRRMIYGTPFWGEMRGTDTAAGSPVSGSFFLRHAAADSIRSLETFETVARLIDCIICPFPYPEIADAVLGACLDFATSVPAAELSFALPVTFWSHVDEFVRTAVSAKP